MQPTIYCTWEILLSLTPDRLPSTWVSHPKEHYSAEKSPTDLNMTKRPPYMQCANVSIYSVHMWACVPIHLYFSNLPRWVAALKALGIFLTLAMISLQDLSTLRNMVDSAGSCLLMSGAKKILSKYSQFLWHVSHSSWKWNFKEIIEEKRTQRKEQHSDYLVSTEPLVPWREIQKSIKDNKALLLLQPLGRATV